MSGQGESYISDSQQTLVHGSLQSVALTELLRDIRRAPSICGARQSSGRWSGLGFVLGIPGLG